jgi:uncharacterized protein YbbC (DUF1343 family)
MRAVSTGLEVFLQDGLPGIHKKRVGLITNPSGIDRHLRSTVDLLHDRVRLEALFGPEHGIRGDAQDGIEVTNGTDARTGLPIYSLYGKDRGPTEAMLKDLDALIFDIQDVGVRYYTYISTLFHVQAAAAQAGIECIIFDRCNPLSGRFVEGNVLDPHFQSFVGIYPLPVRYAMTIGELARLFAAEQGWPAPTIVPLRGWNRSCWFDQTNQPWVFPSPNLPTLDAVILYPGTCLFEGTSCSEGRGTTRPFEIFGAPWLNPFDLADALNTLHLPGVAFRPLYFTPISSKHAGVTCGGVQVHITNREWLRTVEMGLHLLRIVRSFNPERFTWVQYTEGYPCFIDKLAGSDQLRLGLDRGADVASLMRGWAEQQAAFEQRRRPHLLYGE